MASQLQPAPVPRPERGIGRWVKDPFCGLSHGFGAIASVVGLVLLLIYARPDASAIVGISVYGVSMITLYVASCLVHSLHCSARTENRLERFDYAAIFFLIAGTYTPICLNTLHGAWGWSLLGVEYGLALLGATMVLWRGPQRMWVLLYVPMGWMVLIAAAPLVSRMDTLSLLLLLIGGMIYSLGAVVFITNRPRLCPGFFGSHDLWHLMVLAGSACHFVTITQLTT